MKIKYESAKICPICVDREEGRELLPLQKDADWTLSPSAGGESGVQNATITSQESVEVGLNLWLENG